MGTWHGGYIYRGSPRLIELNERIMAERPSGPERAAKYLAGRPLAPCGTKAARRRHRERREDCPVCGYTWMSRSGAARLTVKERLELAEVEQKRHAGVRAARERAREARVRAQRDRKEGKKS